MAINHARIVAPREVTTEFHANDEYKSLRSAEALPEVIQRGFKKQFRRD